MENPAIVPASWLIRRAMIRTTQWPAVEARIESPLRLGERIVTPLYCWLRCYPCRMSRRADGYASGGRRQQRFCEARLIGQREPDNFGLLNGLLCGLLDGDHSEIGHGAPLKFGGTFEHRVQFGTDSGFETGARGGCGHGVTLLPQTHGKLPYISRSGSLHHRSGQEGVRLRQHRSPACSEAKSGAFPGDAGALIPDSAWPPSGAALQALPCRIIRTSLPAWLWPCA